MSEIELPEGTTIIPINPMAKYVLRIGEEIPDDELERIITRLNYWWEGNDPFLIVPNLFTLVRVDKADIIDNDQVDSVAYAFSGEPNVQTEEEEN